VRNSRLWERYLEVSLINGLRVAEDMIENNPQNRCLGYVHGSTNPGIGPLVQAARKVGAIWPEGVLAQNIAITRLFAAESDWLFRCYSKTHLPREGDRRAATGQKSKPPRRQNARGYNGDLARKHTHL
jgi:hypothetical protein